MSEFIYYFGAWAFAIGCAWATLAAVNFIENGGKTK